MAELLADGRRRELQARTGQSDPEQVFLHLIDHGLDAAMNPRLLLATAGRVLAQLRHDHRTIALLVGVPTVLHDPAVVDLRRRAGCSTRPAPRCWASSRW
jgi:hypothetical protein